MSDDEHDHDHPHDANTDDGTADHVRSRVRAMQSLLTEKGIVSTDAIDEAISAYETDVGPLNGARVVARAWADPEFKERLLADANDALEAFDFEVGVQHIEVKENTASIHNAVVCTLCSCYPWSLLGLPPTWYKSPAYRSRMVREPRSVLAEFGLELDDVDVNVWDSSSEVRYMVLPRQPPGTDVDEEELVDVVTRDAMIGVERLGPHAAADGGRPRDRSSAEGAVDAVHAADAVAAAEPGASLQELFDDEGPTFAAPWQARAFGIAGALHDDGASFEWSAFQEQLIDAIEATAPDAYVGDDPQAATRETYYEQWVAALERLLVDEEYLDPSRIDVRTAEFLDGNRTAEEFLEGEREH